MRPDMKDLLMDQAGRTVTENGAVTNATTGNDVLNLYALGGAVRGRKVEEVVDLIDAAWRDDQDLALRTIFYLADVRGGQGERDFFFNALRYLARKNPGLTKRLLTLVPEYSRWDMLFAFVGTNLEVDAFGVMYNQFLEDEKSEYPSLLAKWLPSPGTKNPNGTKELAVKVARAFHMSLQAYRKRRAALNRKIKTVEVFMSAQNWDEIDFEKVPARAFMIYQKAFERHGYEKMEKHIEKIQSGEVKVKSDTLYPHDIMKKALNASGNEIITLQNAWDNLPNYLGEGRKGIAVIDTSASMSGLGWGTSRPVEPMLVAKSLGLYLSERLTGPYKDHYITFSERPIMAKFHGETLARRYNNMQSIVANTNIKAVFDLILDVAVRNNLQQEDLPTHIYIFSDMEFDACVTSSSDSWSITKVNRTLFEKIKDEYNRKGYRLPQVIFWNLDARHNQHPVKQHETGSALVSGFSPTAFKFISEGVVLTPMEVMIETLNSPRYAKLSKFLKEE